jgi:hypothetical protein
VVAGTGAAPAFSQLVLLPTQDRDRPDFKGERPAIARETSPAPDEPFVRVPLPRARPRPPLPLPAPARATVAATPVAPASAEANIDNPNAVPRQPDSAGSSRITQRGGVLMPILQPDPPSPAATTIHGSALLPVPAQ